MADKEQSLKMMKICRFCFSDNESNLLNIYEKNKRSVPLALQIMSCMAIEVFPNDGLPQFICTKCKIQTQQCYVFKSNCKRAQEALKQFLHNNDTNFETPSLQPVKFPIKMSSREFKVISKVSDASGIITDTKRLTDGTEVITLNVERGVESPQMEIREINEHNSEKPVNDQESMDVSNTIEYEIINDGQETPELQLSDSKITDDKDDEGMDENTPVAEFPCHICDQTFLLEKLLNNHLNLQHHIRKPYPCDLCNKKFSLKIQLKKHALVHSGLAWEKSPNYQCQLCQKTFVREYMLRRHQLVHNNDYCIRCVLCGDTFSNSSILETHMETHERTDTLSCPKCSKSFVFRQGLERHLLSHQEKLHKCNYCEAVFDSAIQLTKHTTEHSGLRPYHCKVCKHNFTINHHLTRHMKCHAAIECGKSLDEIIMRYKCDLCSMAFERQYDLLEHSIIHSMVNVTCVICNTSFDTADEVQSHIKTHLMGGLEYPCDKCDYSFDQADQLEKHSLKHAQMEYEEKIEEELVAEARRKMAEVTKQLANRLFESGRRSSESETSQKEEEENEETEEENNEVLYTIDLQNEELLPATPQRNSSPERLIVNETEFTSENFMRPEFDMDPQDEPMEEEYNVSLSEQHQESEHNSNSRHLFKCEIESDEEQDAIPFDNQENYDDDEEPQAVEETLKPIVRNEGTKMYARKGPIERKLPEHAPIETTNLASPDEINEIPMLNLTQENIPTKPMQTNLEKMGDMVVKVQKFILTKDEIKKLQKQGLIDVRGARVVVKSQNSSILDASIKPIQKRDIDNFIKSSTKTQVRSYQRRITENEANILEKSESFRSQL